MEIVYSDRHRLHRSAGEFNGGRIMPAVERPERADSILAHLRSIALGPVREPRSFGAAPLARVHSARYLDFLKSAHGQWAALYGDTDAFPINWAVRGLSQREPEQIEGRLGFFGGDAGTPITKGTWAAATTAADVALTAAALVRDGRRTAFALCRPPGHHAASDVYNGYCFLNNAAIAAQWLVDQGAARVAILDVDYHHGNGTQEIFYPRGDVLFVSLHADPLFEYPFFLGYADETGAGTGEGATLNLPMPLGTAWHAYGEALAAATSRIAAFAPDILVVSFGADTYEADPISHFKLTSDDFSRMGETVTGLAVPTLIVMEGGYAVDALGRNVGNFLSALQP